MQRLSWLAIVFAGACLMAPAASAQCDISQTKCALNGGKCNIKFKNRTNETGGSSGGTSLEQAAQAQTIVIKARKSNGNKAGNKLVITSGASATMNIEKKAKKDFQDIRISSQTASESVDDTNMSCEDVKAILNGNGVCKVFNGYDRSNSALSSYRLGYQCDGGNVSGPPKDN